jgi:acetyl-CoA C-acetyltransferase
MERKVVVAGWGQITQPKKPDTSGKAAMDPMGLMTRASDLAGESMGSKTILKHLDGIMVVRTLSRHYPSPARQLAQNLGSAPRFVHVSGIGGNSPQTLINMAAGMIAGNELDSVLITGAEAYVQRDVNPEKIESALFRGIPDDYPGDDIIGSTPLENAHGIEHPMQGFPLFETALWAASGLDLKTYLLKIGRMWSEFSKVAATHPQAWSKTVRTPEEIITTGPVNRPIAFPYTKYMNSFVTVDQGAAVILMAEETAEKYRQKGHRPVYFLGGGYAEDRQRFMVEKSDFTSSPPLAAAVERALDRSGMAMENLDCFDLYSCFPCAISIAKKMIKIADDDKRPLTLTGGLGFFGGPGNNYSLHGVATLAQKISTGQRSSGLVTALGWFMHKHAAGIYGSIPADTIIRGHHRQDLQNPLAGEPPVQIKDQVTGMGVVETYTIVFSTDQKPSYAVLYGKTHDHFRFIARTRSHPDIFNELTSANRVGQRVKIHFDSARRMNIAEFI